MGASLSTKSKRRGRGGGFRPMSDINVTPFVDVMLVLLIVFMVAAPLLTAGVEVDLPDSRAKAISDPNDKPIEISITKDGDIYVGETKVERERVIPLLTSISENIADQKIYIRGDQNIAYGKMIELIGDINAAGFTQVALISDSVQ